MGFPYLLPFVLPNGGVLGSISTVNEGAVNDAPIDVLKKHVHPAFRNKTAWEALLGAFAAGDTVVMDNNRTMFDQLFICSASEEYLDAKAADVGIRRSPNLGISDDYFRQLTITLSSLKVVSEALLECLRVFYGDESVRAYTTSDIYEPFDITDGESIKFLVNGRQSIEIVFNEEDFSDITEASATEVATIVTRAFQHANVQAYALPVSIDGNSFVRIYSNALGLRSSVVCTGGLAQTSFRFPFYYDPMTGHADTEWDVTVSLSDGTATLYCNAFGDPSGFVALRAGDYLISKLAGFEGTRSWKIDSVIWNDSEVTFVVDLDGDETLLSSGHITGVNASNFFFFRGITSTVLDSQLPAYIVQPSENYVDVILPVTTLVVNRTPDTGAYLQDGTNYEQGLWLMNPNEDVAVTRIETTTTIPLAKYTSVSDLSVTDVTPLDPVTGEQLTFNPDGGWLVIGFGTKYQTAPIRYYGIREDSNNLVIDRYVFERDIPSGVSVIHLYQRAPWVPTGIPGIGYVTASSVGYQEVNRVLDETVAAGVVVNKIPTYPGDRGLGGEGLAKSDKVYIWGGDDN